MSRKYALIIGNTEYGDPGLAQLTAPGKDAEDFARILKDQNFCAFNEVNVLLDQPSSSVIETIDEFFDQKKPDDLLVLYFSGHGIRDEIGALYLAFKNTIRSRLRSTAIKSDYIREAMDQSRSKRQVLILDCCNSGAFPQGTKAETGGAMGMAKAFQGYGRFVLTASDATQFAWEGDKVIGETDNSLFTHFLVKGLEGEADSDGDGRITVDEIYDYTYQQISKVTPKQTPTKSSSKQEGEIILRENMRIEDIKPIALSEDLINEIEDTRPYVREIAVQKLEKIIKGKNIGLARSAREALEKIAEDENTTRRVAQAATQILESIRQVEQKVEEERKTREEAERLAMLKAEEERLAREKAEAERKDKEETEKLARAQAEREAAKREAAQLKTEQEVARKKVERKAAEKAEREAVELAARRKAEWEAKEKVSIKDSKVIRPSWIRFGIIGGAIITLVLCGFAATRVFPAIFEGSAVPTLTEIPIASHTQSATAVNTNPTVTESLSLLWMAMETPQRNNIGSLLAYENGDDVFIATLDGTIINKIPGKSTSCLFPPSISPDGNMIATIGSGGIELLNMQNLEQVEFKTRTIGLPIGLSWSPDGKYIVFSDGSSGPDDLYIADIDGSNIHNITNNGEYNAFPDWSPDGKEIAFTSTRGQVNGVYVINQNGRLRSIVTDTSGVPYAPRWSPDGTKIAYVFDHVGTDGYYDYSQVFVVYANGDQSPIPISDPLNGWEPGAVGWAYPVVWIDNNTVLAINNYDGWYSLNSDHVSPKLLDKQISGNCVDFLP